MSDLISRQAAINAIENTECELIPAAWDEITDAINELPSAQPNWIPVKKMLPEVNGRYLVTRGLAAAGAFWNRVYIANYSDLMGIKSEKIWWQGNVGKSDFERLDDVVSWMPLPEPWKGEQS